VSRTKSATIPVIVDANGDWFAIGADKQPLSRSEGDALDWFFEAGSAGVYHVVHVAVELPLPDATRKVVGAVERVSDVVDPGQEG
jgi:hypothetical protein